MGRSDHSDSALPSPAHAQPSADLARLCQRLRQSLELNHTHCPEADRTGLSLQLLQPDSQARQILSQGFQHLVVFDARLGLGADGQFDLIAFLRYIAEELNAIFSLESRGQHFHPEDVSQILKDEQAPMLLCFVGIQHIPYEALQRLRGFTQETHRCLFCGQHEFGSAVETPAEPSASVLDDEFSLELDDSDVRLVAAPDDDEVSLGSNDRKRSKAAASDIKQVMKSIASNDGEIDLSLEDEGISLELDDNDDDDGISIFGQSEPERNTGDSHVALVMDRFDALAMLDGADFLASPLFDDEQRKLSTLSHQAALLLARGQFDEAMQWLIAQESACEGANEPLAACLAGQVDVEIARGNWPAALELLQRQQKLLAKRGALLSGCLGQQAVLLKKHGQLDEALAALESQATICREIGQMPELVAVLVGQVQILAARKKFDAALTQLYEQEQICRLYALHEPLVQCLGQQAVLLRQTGQNDAALAVLREQQRIAEEIGKPQIVAVALGNQAALYEASGDFASAESHYRQGEQLCRQLQAHELLVRNLANQAFLLSNKLHRHREALPRAEEALRLAKQHALTALVKQIQPIWKGILARVNSSG